MRRVVGWGWMAILGWVGMAWGGVEDFSSIPLGTGWNRVTNEWDGAEGTIVSAYNARKDWVESKENPAIAIQSESAATKGWVRVATTNESVQRVRAKFRQALSGKAVCDVRVNGQLVGEYQSQGNTGMVDTVECEVLDTETGWPMVGNGNGVEIVISNRLANSGTVAIDDVEWEEWTVFVKLFDQNEKEVTGKINEVQALDGEFVEKGFDITARIWSAEGELGEESAGGSWTIKPALQGEVIGLEGRQLTVLPALEDVGGVFALTYTAEREVGEGDSAHVVRHSATAWLKVKDPSYRWITFEDVENFSKATNGIATNVDLGGPWNVHGGHRAGTTNDPKVGKYSIGLVHTSHQLPGWMESDFEYKLGIGTVSMRYANLNENSPKVTLLVQTKALEDEEWRTVEDGVLVAEEKYDMGGAEFRVDVQEEGSRMLRIATANVPGNPGMRVNLDDIRIRRFGETAPVLLWRGETVVGDAAGWSGCFVYTNAGEGDFEWGWAAEGPLAEALLCETNGNRLDFTVPDVVTAWATNQLTAWVTVDGEEDQRRKVELLTGAPPEFELWTPRTEIRLAETNIVDVWVTNVVLHGGGSDWRVAWNAEPAFNGTNSVNNKSRYRVLDLEQEEDSEHVLTAILTETGTQLSAKRSLTFRVVAKGEGPGPEPPGEFRIVKMEGDSLLVQGTQTGWMYRLFGVESLLPGVAPSNWIWEGAERPGTGEEELRLPIEGMTNHNVRFYGVVGETR